MKKQTRAKPGGERSFRFDAEIWLYQGQGAWHFVTLPKDVSDTIRFLAFETKSAWGSVRVRARTGNSIWDTSIFPDRKAGAYLLPIKADIRKRENLRAGDTAALTIAIA